MVKWKRFDGEILGQRGNQFLEVTKGVTVTASKSVKGTNTRRHSRSGRSHGETTKFLVVDREGMVKG